MCEIQKASECDWRALDIDGPLVLVGPGRSARGPEHHAFAHGSPPPRRFAHLQHRVDAGNAESSGQAILAKSGLLPVLSREALARRGSIEAAAPSSGIRVIESDGTATAVSLAELQALPAASATLPGEHGTQLQVSGPALWDVLRKAGVIDPEFENKKVIAGLVSDGTA